MTEQMSHIFQYTFQFLLHSDNFCNRYICLLLHCTNSLIHLRGVLSSDKKQSIDLHVNHLTGFYVIETLTLIYHFRAMFHLFILSLKTSEKLSEVLGGILKFSQCIEMTNWSEMGNMSWSFNHQCPSHTETSQLICSTNQLTGFYMRGTLVVKELKY